MIAGCSRYPLDNSNKYANQDYSLKYPDGWIVDDHTQFVYFKTPLEGDELQENVVIYVSPAEKDADVISFFQDSVMTLVGTTPGFTLVSHDETYLSSEPAQRIVYTEDGELGTLKYLQVFALKNDKAYIVTYSAPADKYDKYVSGAEEIIKSFRIK